MPRDARAYLADIVGACQAIEHALAGVALAEYQRNRLVRSSVEREFIIIGEAVAALARVAPEVFEGISASRKIVAFRNRLTHEYSAIDDALVWALSGREVPQLRQECMALLKAADPSREESRS